MPIFEMPLEKLLAYQGVNPRPENFDEYWDESIREMHALGTAHTLEKGGIPGAGH